MSRHPIQVLFLTLLSAACTGTIQPNTTPGEGVTASAHIPAKMGQSVPPASVPEAATPASLPPGNAPAFQPGKSSLRRLTVDQFHNAVTDLLGAVNVTTDLEGDTRDDGLIAIGAARLALSPRGVEQQEAAVRDVVTQLFATPASRDAVLGCTPGSVWDETCARAFLTRLGRRAWRRPVTPDESDRYLALGKTVTQLAGGFARGVQAMLSAILQSPHFLYRVELGSDPAPGQPWSRFSSWEMASRLSFLLWNSLPDEALLTAAESHNLDDVAGIRKEAQRLLQAPQARQGLRSFVSDVYSLEAINLMAKDPKLYPQLTPSLRTAMQSEVQLLFEDAVFDRNADLMELFDTQRTFANKELGKLYGATVASDVPVAIDQPAQVPRAGLLTAAGLLAVQDKQQETSPTRRGRFVRQILLCQQIPDPPTNVVPVFKDPPAGVVLTRRQQLADHRTEPACAACHGFMDPIGLSLENFDALGIYRTTDRGMPIDTSGDLAGTAFAGPRELGRLLHESSEARQCMVRSLFRFATGREEGPGEAGVLQRLDQNFAGGGRRMKDLLLDLVSSDSFRFADNSHP